MGDGKDRAKVEAVLNRSRFDISEIKEVVDGIYDETTSVVEENDTDGGK